MLVTWAALDVYHTTNAYCTKGAEYNCRRLAAEEMQVSI